MSALVCWPARVWTLSFCIFLSQAAGLPAADLVLQKVPALTSELSATYPENVRYCPVAQVEAMPQGSPIEGLKVNSKSEDSNVGDPTVGYLLSNGGTTLLVSLSKIEIIDSIVFRNSGAKGKVLIATANAKLPANGPQWHEVIEQDLTPEVVKIKIGPSEAKYVKLTFSVIKDGRIGRLGLYSMPLVSDLIMPHSRKIVEGKSASAALISYNVSDAHLGARVLYVSSGEDLKVANNMINEQSATSYRFAKNDTTPTAIIDLGEVARLRRISTIYSPVKSTVDFYVLKILPGETTSTGENASQTLRVSENVLAELKPVGSVVDDSTGHAAIDFPATTGRYIMLKWNPATRDDTTFGVAKVAAFGSNEMRLTNLTVANVSFAGADSASVPDSKDVTIDAKDKVVTTDAKDKDVTMDAQDFQECCNEPESPAEGPATGPEPPPPIVIIPIVSQ